MRQTGDPLFEYACHEGNYALGNILAGARADEKKAAAQGIRTTRLPPVERAAKGVPGYATPAAAPSVAVPLGQTKQQCSDYGRSEEHWMS